ncbi:DUF7676 family protein [Rhodococcus opacus]
MFNGRDEQMLTIMLPTPFLINTQRLTEEPVWEHLEAWDRIRGISGAGTRSTRSHR